MRAKPYKRKPGELELRVLKDGRLVMVAPDEALLEIGRALESPDESDTAAPEQQNAEPPAGTG